MRRRAKQVEQTCDFCGRHYVETDDDSTLYGMLSVEEYLALGGARAAEARAANGLPAAAEMEPGTMLVVVTCPECAVLEDVGMSEGGDLRDDG